MAFIGQSAPNIRKKMQWIEGLQDYTIRDVVKEAEKVYHKREVEDEKQEKVTKVSEFDKLWGDNPIFFISNEETARMKALATERFDFVKEAAKNKENKIIIKIGLPVDNEGNFEHIWFELIEFEGDNFRAKLTQEPYNVDNIHEGDERVYTVKDVTDWIIYTPDFAVNPSNAYLLK